MSIAQTWLDRITGGFRRATDLGPEDRGPAGLIPRNDKATRLLSVSHLIEGGRFAVPEDALWLADFQREVTLFPNGKHDDQVDSLSQFLIWFAELVSMPRIRAL